MAVYAQSLSNFGMLIVAIELSSSMRFSMILTFVQGCGHKYLSFCSVWEM